MNLRLVCLSLCGCALASKGDLGTQRLQEVMNPVNNKTRFVSLSDPGNLLGRVLFGVMCSMVKKDRATAVKNGWCGQPGVRCIFFSDGPGLNVEPVISHGDGRGSYEDAQKRFLPALQELKDSQAFKGNEVDWVMLVDDDTHVFVHNLLHSLSHFDPQNVHYRGAVAPVGWFDKEELVRPTGDFVMGGGGSLFSHAAMAQMDLQECIRKQNAGPGSEWHMWQSDWMIGACAEFAGIKPSEDNRFHQWLTDGRGGGSTVFPYPISVHPVPARHMTGLMTEYPYSNSQLVQFIDTASSLPGPKDGMVRELAKSEKMKDIGGGMFRDAQPDARDHARDVHLPSFSLAPQGDE